MKDKPELVDRILATVLFLASPVFASALVFVTFTLLLFALGYSKTEVHAIENQIYYWLVPSYRSGAWVGLLFLFVAVIFFIQPWCLDHIHGFLTMKKHVIVEAHNRRIRYEKELDSFLEQLYKEDW